MAFETATNMFLSTVTGLMAHGLMTAFVGLMTAAVSLMSNDP